ncbi:MAG: ATP-dependent RNA helicase SrmB [Shewanellaceae bacterium]|nr:ATP-dependent RNA helicase SrmB [Shewanellaceae bacterium]
MQFDAYLLDDALLAALTRMQHHKPTSIQQLVLPPALQQKDILAQAPTGTGKSAAFILPMLQYLLDFPRQRHREVRALILAPTRELAVQLHQYASHLAYNTELKIGIITGGQDYIKQKAMLEGVIDVMIATPGRLIEYIAQAQFDLDGLELMVIDEADRMLDMGFAQAVTDVAQAAIHRQQTMLFSATLEGNGIQRFAEKLLQEPVRIEATPSRREHGKIHQWLHLADDFEHKLAMLFHILKQPDVARTIVFTKTRERANELIELCQPIERPLTLLHGDMIQKERFRALAKFKQEQNAILITTDLAARGLDVLDISHIINFDLPRTADVYVHRIGRTGRAGAKGTAISLVEAHDMTILEKIERYTQQKIKRRIIEELPPKHKAAKVPTKKKKKTKKNKLK